MLGRVEHIVLPTSMKCANTLLQCLKNALAEKTIELAAVQVAHQLENKALETRVLELQHELDTERTENAAIIRRLTQLLPHPPLSSSNLAS